MNAALTHAALQTPHQAWTNGVVQTVCAATHAPAAAPHPHVHSWPLLTDLLPNLLPPCAAPQQAAPVPPVVPTRPRSRPQSPHLGHTPVHAIRCRKDRSHPARCLSITDPSRPVSPHGKHRTCRPRELYAHAAQPRSTPCWYGTELPLRRSHFNTAAHTCTNAMLPSRRHLCICPIARRPGLGIRSSPQTSTA